MILVMQKRRPPLLWCHRCGQRAGFGTRLWDTCDATIETRPARVYLVNCGRGKRVIWQERRTKVCCGTFVKQRAAAAAMLREQV